MQKYGFTLIDERSLVEVGGVARLWKHDLTGAQALSITNQDENKCFGANFFTPPVNSTGVAHILEHSVLCGSDKYPVKEPFVELLKGSLQTFLNAFTFPDKTCYPVASANLQDFYNLVDVYLDAVFHPLLNEDIFKQEGWHVDADSADGPWSFKGVVYNEMKGVYSSPDSVIAEKSQQAVFPDNLYSFDSGGNPEKIPDLTYAAFVDFHNRYYQPGNTRFFFWGDDPEDERLRILEKALANYGPISNLPTVPLQKPFASPIVQDFPYAATDGDERALCTVNWLLCERGDVGEAMKISMLEHILEGLPGSPLRRALMESGLGEDTTGCGLETDLRQMYYSTGLKGLAPADVGKCEELILSTLQKLVEGGIEKAAVEAAINSVEFAYRENNTGMFPRGLAAMIQSLSTWLYGGNPLAPLAWEQPLEQIKSAVAKGEKVFENAIKKYFLENTHRIRVSLFPDPALGQKIGQEEKARLNAIQEEMAPQSRANVVRETALLREKQTAPDSPEALATIPALKKSDLPLKNIVIPQKIENLPPTFASHALPTRGIAYTSLYLPIQRLPQKLAPYLSLFCRSLTEWGTAKEDYSQLGMRIAANLGGLGSSPLFGAQFGSQATYAYLGVSAKAVYDHLDDMFSLMNEILLEPQTDRDIIKQRLEQMILEDKARLEYSLQASGHAAVLTRLKAHFSADGALNEDNGGISQLMFLRNLAGRMENEPDQVLNDFEELRQILIHGTDLIFNCTAEEAALDKMRQQAQTLANALSRQANLEAGTPLDQYAPMDNLPRAEAFITPGQVNYVGKAANLYKLGYKFSGSAYVISRWLRMGRLWEQVRVSGGAYGVFCSFEPIHGVFSCASYRDPNVDNTLAAYDGLGDYLRSFIPSRENLDQAIVGAVGALDTYLLPAAKGDLAFARWLNHQSVERLQQTRDEMLATSARDFHEFAAVMDAFAANGLTCVLGGEATSSAAREHDWTEQVLM